MKRILGIFLGTILCISGINAEDIYLVNGDVYRNVLIIAKTEFGVKFQFNYQKMEITNSEILEIDSSKVYNKDSISYFGSSDPQRDAELFKNAPKDPSPFNDNLIYLGYSGNLPKIPFGLTFGITNLDKIGYYISLKLSPNSVQDNELYENISRNKAENIYRDKRIGAKDQYVAFDIGISVRVFKPLFILGGVGYSHWSEYLNYRDETEILGKNGSYYINGNDKSGINLSIGAGLIITNGWYISIGGNTTPSGVEIGIGKMLNGIF